MSRISVFIKNELSTLKSLFQSINFDRTGKILANFSNIIETFVSIFLSIEFYKQNKLGRSIGFLNYSINLIATNNEADGEDLSRLKSRISSLRNKIKANQSVSRSKLNKSLIQLSPSNPQIFVDITNLQFQLIEALKLKYHLQNNNLNYETIEDSSKLMGNFLPNGRPVPIEETRAWQPDFMGVLSCKFLYFIGSPLISSLNPQRAFDTNLRNELNSSNCPLEFGIRIMNSVFEIMDKIKKSKGFEKLRKYISFFFGKF
ncbi:hypothetical protein WICMUC_002689 [Wickerhamomyces mucosus]|uniref:Uncharacterized protein n=1 Tax=Wickerhamomyces mucosus TaxID=1378264 RepID=A0A9P8TDH9_9ASCO|nr:hypothetical protein WICMUC_002689 [Wickerhamomyces mucosus]